MSRVSPHHFGIQLIHCSFEKNAKAIEKDISSTELNFQYILNDYSYILRHIASILSVCQFHKLCTYQDFNRSSIFSNTMNVLFCNNRPRLTPKTTFTTDFSNISQVTRLD